MIKKDSNTINGVLPLLQSSLSFSLMTVCVKLLGGRIPTAELVFIRAIFSLLVTRIILYKNGINPWGKNKKLLFIRGALGSIALFLIFNGIKTLPLSIATIIQYTYPSFSAIGAWYFLKEGLKKRIFLAVIIGWTGIAIVVYPDMNLQSINHYSAIYILLALAGSLFTALAYICVRQLSKTEHPLVIIHYFPLVSIPFSLPFFLKGGVMPIGVEWLWLLGIGIFTQLGQIWLTKGLQALPAARATSINYSQVIFATFWGSLIFSETITSYVLIGSIFVLCSTVLCSSAKECTQSPIGLRL